ncbi:MAG: hypothetical protein PHO10_06215 [Gemmiger sp.]|nr:hypothetical protein [Gemmiger sp.]
MTFTDILMVVLLVLIAGVGIYLYYRKKNKPDPNAAPAQGSGEPTRDGKANAAFARKLKSAAWKRGLTIVFPNPDKSPFTAILVSPAGVTAYYGADYNGTVYGGPDEQWAQISGGVRRPFRSPLLAAEDARKQLRDGLTAARLGAFMVSCRVVLTAPKAELVIPRNTGTRTAKEVLHEIEFSEELMANRRVDEAAVKKYLEENYS